MRSGFGASIYAISFPPFQMTNPYSTFPWQLISNSLFSINFPSKPRQFDHFLPISCYMSIFIALIIFNLATYLIYFICNYLMFEFFLSPMAVYFLESGFYKVLLFQGQRLSQEKAAGGWAFLSLFNRILGNQEMPMCASPYSPVPT